MEHVFLGVGGGDPPKRAAWSAPGREDHGLHPRDAHLCPIRLLIKAVCCLG